MERLGKPGLMLIVTVGPQQMILRLCHLAPRVVGLHLCFPFECGLANLPDLTREPAMRSEVIVLGGDVNGGAETRMRYGAVVAFEIVLEHRLPVGARMPFFALVELKGVEVDSARSDDLKQASEE